MTRKTKRTRVTALKADWYSNPKMNGHHWAIETYRLVFGLKSLAKTKVQKQFLNTCFDFSNTDWHYWCSRISKKDVQLAKHVLKSTSKGESWAENYHWVNERHNMLVDSMTRFLEVMAYDEDPDGFVKDMSWYNRFLGMSADEAERRLHNRIAKFREAVGL